MQSHVDRVSDVPEVRSVILLVKDTVVIYDGAAMAFPVILLTTVCTIIVAFVVVFKQLFLMILVAAAIARKINQDGQVLALAVGGSLLAHGLHQHGLLRPAFNGRVKHVPALPQSREGAERGGGVLGQHEALGGVVAAGLR